MHAKWRTSRRSDDSSTTPSQNGVMSGSQRPCRCDRRLKDSLGVVMVHLQIGRRRDTKNPTSRRGFKDRAKIRSLSRAPIRSPHKGGFFHHGGCARTCDHDDNDAVRRFRCQRKSIFLIMKMLRHRQTRTEKKPGSGEPGFKYWPRWADTITFQEG